MAHLGLAPAAAGAQHRTGRQVRCGDGEHAARARYRVGLCIHTGWQLSVARSRGESQGSRRPRVRLLPPAQTSSDRPLTDARDAGQRAQQHVSGVLAWQARRQHQPCVTQRAPSQARWHTLRQGPPSAAERTSRVVRASQRSAGVARLSTAPASLSDVQPASQSGGLAQDPPGCVAGGWSLSECTARSASPRSTAWSSSSVKAPGPSSRMVGSACDRQCAGSAAGERGAAAPPRLADACSAASPGQRVQRLARRPVSSWAPAAPPRPCRLMRTPAPASAPPVPATAAQAKIREARCNDKQPCLFPCSVYLLRLRQSELGRAGRDLYDARLRRRSRLCRRCCGVARQAGHRDRCCDRSLLRLGPKQTLPQSTCLTGRTRTRICSPTDATLVSGSSSQVALMCWPTCGENLPACASATAVPHGGDTTLLPGSGVAVAAADRRLAFLAVRCSDAGAPASHRRMYVSCCVPPRPRPPTKPPAPRTFVLEL